VRAQDDEVRVQLGRERDDLVGRVSGVDVVEEGGRHGGGVLLEEVLEPHLGELVRPVRVLAGQVGRVHVLRRLHVRDVGLGDADDVEIGAGGGRVRKRTRHDQVGALVQIDRDDDDLLGVRWVRHVLRASCSGAQHRAEGAGDTRCGYPVSAHRTPDWMFEYAETAESRGLEVIIAAAGGAAHLPGMVAAKTLLPVLGVPVPATALQGVDALLVDRADAEGRARGDARDRQARRGERGLLAARIVSTRRPELRERLRAWRTRAPEVLAHRRSEPWQDPPGRDDRHPRRRTARAHDRDGRARAGLHDPRPRPRPELRRALRRWSAASPRPSTTSTPRPTGAALRGGDAGDREDLASPPSTRAALRPRAPGSRGAP
jgi:5-(carboxyamino)imidazole ribonucleotide mutase